MTEAGARTVGGAALVTLRAQPAEGPGLVSADLVPSRGMMLLRLRARLEGREETDLVLCPPLDEAIARLEDPADRHGNAGFGFGGALLLPFANRITGKPSADGQTVVAASPYGSLSLPANWGGTAPGAARYAMHGLILRSAFEVVELTSARVRAVHRGMEFGEAWPGRFDIKVTAVLTPKAFQLTVEVTNTGSAPAPMGIGWHPYFTLPSGRRSQARLRIPAAGRALVADYDEVLPTGVVAPTAGTAHDFAGPDGAALGDLDLDDCFTDLLAAGGSAAVRLVDPASSYALSVTAAAPPVTALQIYAPSAKPFVVIEPQYNLADPFAPLWGSRPTGMVRLEQGQSTRYAVSLDLLPVT